MTWAGLPRPENEKRAKFYTHIHHADLSDFVHRLPIITGVMQNHGDGQNSRHTPKVAECTVIMISWLSYIANTSLLSLLCWLHLPGKLDFSSCSFYHLAPAIWNWLLGTVLESPSLVVLISRLNTHLFHVAHNNTRQVWHDLTYAATTSDVTTLWRNRNRYIIIHYYNSKTRL